VLSLITLIITAYITLPGLHLFAQVVLVILIVGWPLFFHQRWLNLFRGKAEVETVPRLLGPVALAIISVIISLVGVAFASGVSNRTGELPQGIPLTATNVPEGVSANFGSQTSARVIITASRESWAVLKAENFSAVVDVGNQGEGTYDLPILVTPKISNVKVIRVKPKRAIVTVEPVIRKTLPLVAKFSGSAGDELVPDEPIFEPEKLEVAGPKSIVNDLSSAVVQIKLSGETAAIRTKLAPVALTAAGEIIPGLSFSPAEVEVTVPLVKAGNRKTVGIKPIITGNPASGYWVKNLSVNPAVATVTGAPDALETVKEITTAPVSVAGLSTNTDLPSTLVLPSGITTADSLSKVTVKVEISSTETTKTVQPELIYDGLSSALKVTAVTPSSITLIISGAANTLNNTADNAAKLNLELGPYQSAGTYSVLIKNTHFTLPSGVGIVSFLPSAVNVTLENR